MAVRFGLTEDEQLELRAASQVALLHLLSERTGELQREIAWQDSADRTLAQMIAVLAAGAAAVAWSFSGLGPRADLGAEKAALVFAGAAYLGFVGFAVGDMIRAFVDVGFNMPRAGREWEATFLSSLRVNDASDGDIHATRQRFRLRRMALFRSIGPAAFAPLRRLNAPDIQDPALRDYLVNRVAAFTEAVGRQRAHNRARDALLASSWRWIVGSLVTSVSASAVELVNRLM